MKKLTTIFAIIGINFISITNIYSQKSAEFPQIQKYLDKINKIDMGYEELVKLSQKLSGKTFTSIETYDGEVYKEYYENIKWEDFEYAEYIEHYEDSKIYTRCDFIFKTNFTKTTENSSDKYNILSCFIFKKDILAVKQAVEEFEENQVNKYISNQNSTQLTNYKDVTTWKTISSLNGENLDNTKKILKSNGMVNKNNNKDKETGLEIWDFVEASEKDNKYASTYTVGLKDNKVVMVIVPYDYNSKDEINMLKDLSVLKKELKLSGYDFTNKEAEKHSSSWGYSWFTFTYFFTKTNENKEVRIFHEPNMNSFTLMFGENKYLDTIKQD